MKRPCKTLAFFWGSWITVLIAGYMIGRVTVFAAGGMANCMACEYCEELTTYWLTTPSETNGFETQLLPTPTPQALNGTVNGGILDVYGPGCNPAGDASDTGGKIEFTHYTSADLECVITTAPPPAGRYQCTNGQNPDPNTVTVDQAECIHTD